MPDACACLQVVLADAAEPPAAEPTAEPEPAAAEEAEEAAARHTAATQANGDPPTPVQVAEAGAAPGAAVSWPRAGWAAALGAAAGKSKAAAKREVSDPIRSEYGDDEASHSAGSGVDEAPPAGGGAAAGGSSSSSSIAPPLATTAGRAESADVYGWLDQVCAAFDGRKDALAYPQPPPRSTPSRIHSRLPSPPLH